MRFAALALVLVGCVSTLELESTGGPRRRPPPADEINESDCTRLGREWLAGRCLEVGEGWRSVQVGGAPSDAGADGLEAGAGQ